MKKSIALLLLFVMILPLPGSLADHKKPVRTANDTGYQPYDIPWDIKRKEMSTLLAEKTDFTFIEEEFGGPDSVHFFARSENGEDVRFMDMPCEYLQAVLYDPNLTDPDALPYASFFATYPILKDTTVEEAVKTLPPLLAMHKKEFGKPCHQFAYLYNPYGERLDFDFPLLPSGDIDVETIATALGMIGHVSLEACYGNILLNWELSYYESDGLVMECYTHFYKPSDYTRGWDTHTKASLGNLVDEWYQPYMGLDPIEEDFLDTLLDEIKDKES